MAVSNVLLTALSFAQSASEYEKILQNFQRRFSDIDKMEIQDCLIRHNWDKEAAMKELDLEYTKLVEKNKSKTPNSSSLVNAVNLNVGRRGRRRRI